MQKSPTTRERLPPSYPKESFQHVLKAQLLLEFSINSESLVRLFKKAVKRGFPAGGNPEGG
jgi:hypothetical protein